jgi:integrase
MAVYRPSYRDQKTGELVESKIWWYNFTFAGRRIQESSKSKRKTVAQDAEKKRRMELERAFNDVSDRRRERIRSVSEVLAEFLEGYKLRNPKSATFAEYAVGHVTRILGTALVVDLSETAVKEYQTARLKEQASPKSINEEVGFLLRVLGDQGDAIRARLKRQSALKLSVGRRIARAFTPDEKAALLAAAKERRSPSIYPALMLALHVGMRDAELRGLRWSQIALDKAVVTVGESKTEAGEGRTIPLNADVLAAVVAHSKWYLEKFGETRPEWYVFPFGNPQPTDPTRSATSFKTVWVKVKEAAGVSGRWHDNRHTFITDLAESGEASDETIRDIAGHVSKQMLKHYSHIRMEAKRRAVDALTVKPATVKPSAETETAENGPAAVVSNGAAKEIAKVASVN